MHAAACALVLSQKNIDDFFVHVAIGCGHLCLGILGGDQGRWEYLISGICMQDINQCLIDADTKEVVVTPVVFEILSAVALVGFENLSSGNVLLKGIDIDLLQAKLARLQRKDEFYSLELIEMLSMFIPKIVTSRFFLLHNCFNI